MPINIDKPKRNLTGQRLGRWLVLAFLQYKSGQPLWLCLCRCGNVRIIRTREFDNDTPPICHPCLNVARVISGKPARTMCGVGTAEHLAWKNMRSRCYNKKRGDYKYYGGRGVIVCSRWRLSFGNFLADMGPRPSTGHSLDRYPDQDGNYEPGNCRWATHTQQMNNTTRVRLYTLGAESMSLPDWARKRGVNYFRLKSRVQDGWDFEKALTAPPYYRGADRLRSCSAS